MNDLKYLAKSKNQSGTNIESVLNNAKVEFATPMTFLLRQIFSKRYLLAALLGYCRLCAMLSSSCIKRSANIGSSLHASSIFYWMARMEGTATRDLDVGFVLPAPDGTVFSFVGMHSSLLRDNSRVCLFAPLLGWSLAIFEWTCIRLLDGTELSFTAWASAAWLVLLGLSADAFSRLSRSLELASSSLEEET